MLGAEPKPQCTGWADELHPPNTVRVARSIGPNAGHVEVVDLWKYVGTVVRAEYSSGSDKPYPWMHIGALTVKQYAWYYASHWRGWKITHTNEDGSTTTECYDLKDTTADQIYRPERKDSVTGEWITANVPTPQNLAAMRATWHMSIRKWQADKNRSRLFLTGYRSGKQMPCGADSTGFKIYQKSLRDCGVKGLTLEETLREYFETNMLFVETRDHDALSDGSSWWGDLGVLAQTSGGTEWRVYPGANDGFGSPSVGTFNDVSYGQIVGQGSGNVDSPDFNGADDSRLLADVVMLANNGSRLYMARATGIGFAAPTSQEIPAGTNAERLLVADFDGDLRADAGLLSNAGNGLGTLSVMRSNGDGSFGSVVQWWTGPLDMGAGDLTMAGDTNGDGKADLIVRDGAGLYSVAASSASCLLINSWGPCPEVGPIGLSALSPANTTAWSAANAKHVVGDYDRDGRDDLIVVLNNGGGIKVVGMRSTRDGTFTDPAELWSGAIAFEDLVPVALDVNPDGMADLALIHRTGVSSTLTWLRAVERSIVPAKMTSSGSYVDISLGSGSNFRAF
ncbi:MAG: VCBS repeat-containing protein [Candidatus Limnocylindrales bacterium]